MEELMAGSAQELVALLAATDISVPPRTRGRRSRHVERYSVALLLATLADRELGYPLSLVHRDRPDYQLEMDGRRIGVEHTEAVPENEAHRSALREQGHGPDVHFINREDVDIHLSHGSGKFSLTREVLAEEGCARCWGVGSALVRSAAAVNFSVGSTWSEWWK